MSTKLDHTPRPIVAAIGEALFDCFPDRAVLGGAPVNFAVHLQQLLADPPTQVAVVSGIGQDELGARLIEEVKGRNVRTDFMQVVPGRETGQVQVTLSAAGEPSYTIAEHAAWDYIEFSEPLRRLAAGCRAVYFGTLAQRSPQSREAIQAFVSAATGATRILDLNLRQPHVDAAVIEASLTLANVVKLNEEELFEIAAMLPSAFGDGSSPDELAQRLLKAFNLKNVALTRGPRGTVLYGADARLEGDAVPAPPKATGADSVGAGDACCAGLAFGLLQAWPLPKTLELANLMGAYVASQPGGTPRLPNEVLDLAGGGKHLSA